MSRKIENSVDHPSSKEEHQVKKSAEIVKNHWSHRMSSEKWDELIASYRAEINPDRRKKHDFVEAMGVLIKNLCKIKINEVSEKEELDDLTHAVLVKVMEENPDNWLQSYEINGKAGVPTYVSKRVNWAIGDIKRDIQKWVGESIEAEGDREESFSGDDIDEGEGGLETEGGVRIRSSLTEDEVLRLFSPNNDKAVFITDYSNLATPERSPRRVATLLNVFTKLGSLLPKLGMGLGEDYVTVWNTYWGVDKDGRVLKFETISVKALGKEIGLTENRFKYRIGKALNIWLSPPNSDHKSDDVNRARDEFRILANNAYILFIPVSMLDHMAPQVIADRIEYLKETLKIKGENIDMDGKGIYAMNALREIFHAAMKEHYPCEL